MKEWGSVKMIFQQATLRPALMVIGDCSALLLEVPKENLCTENNDKARDSKGLIAQNLAPKPTEKLISDLNNMEK